MATYAIYKETAVPGVFQPNGIYLIGPTAKPGELEIYVSDSTGAATRHTPTKTEIQAMIDATISASSGGLFVVDDIAARDALTPVNGQQAFVIDATGDATVNAGAATYIYRSATTSWVKVSEAESLDLVLSWANLTGKPTSSVAAIDAAVTASHTHANKSQLDKVGQDADGFLTYDGASYVRTGSLNW